MIMRELCFIGGDKRQIRVINNMAKFCPHIKIYGFDKAEEELSENVTLCDSLREAIENAEAVILPLPYTKGREMINAPFSAEEIHTGDVLRNMNEGQLLLLGKADEGINAIASLCKIKSIDYLEREELAILNAIPTAEGAIEIAMRETPYALSLSQCLILGNGKIGKVLSKMLSGLGAKVTVCVRKYKDKAYCKSMGIDSIFFSELGDRIGEYDVIFNTAPALVIGYRMLQKIRKESLIIDLASKPGGVDFETAEQMGKKVIWALSLPGEVAPETAGDFISETLINIMEEMGAV